MQKTTKEQKAEVNRRWRESHADEQKAYKAARYAENREELKSKQRQYRLDNPELVAASNRAFREKNQEDLREYDRIRKLEQRDFVRENPDHLRSVKIREINKRKVNKWKKANPEKLNSTRRARRAERWENDPVYKIKQCLFTRTHYAFKRALCGKTDGTMDLLGCSMGRFTEYLQSHFQPGMSFKNYGEWHIDHIKPVSKFNLNNPEQQKQCFNWLNLQPLWAKDNLAKSNKLPQATREFVRGATTIRVTR